QPTTPRRRDLRSCSPVGCSRVGSLGRRTAGRRIGSYGFNQVLRGRHRQRCPIAFGHAFAFFLASRRRHTSFSRDWSSDVCSSDLTLQTPHYYIRMPSLAVLEDDRIQVTLPNGEVRILEPAKRGRPSRAYDPTVLQMFADGLELPEISQATGIKLGTLREWLTRGKHNGNEPYRTIYDLYRDTEGYELDDRPPALHTPPLTHELISQITNLLNQGHHLTTAARLLHIHPNTLYGWLQRGKAEFEDPNNTKTYYDVP